MRARAAFPLAMTVLACAAIMTAAHAQSGPSTAIGWYNGDWQSGIPGLPNWYSSNLSFSRVYDDFVVPQGGWTVVGVFSHNNLYEFPAVQKASWEIRKGMAPGRGGKVVASGRGRATETHDAAPAKANESLYRIEVDGLHVKLAPGRYWLSVSPVGAGQSFLCATLGAGAVGEPGGNNGGALVHSVLRTPASMMRGPNPRVALPPLAANSHFDMAEAVGQYGQRLGVGKDFSQGVIIARTR